MANDPAGKSRQAMQKLLRYLAHGRAGRTTGDQPEMVAFRRGNEARRCFDRRLVAAGLSGGLIRQRGNVVWLDEPGRSWLKRQLCASGETDFSRQHADPVETSIEVDGARQPVTVNTAESPLATLRRLKHKDGTPFLDEHSFQAGERLRADFTRGQLQPRVSANWEASVSPTGMRAGGGIADLSDAALGARMRVERALAAVGPELSGPLVDICCFLKGLETVERERQWPVRSAKLMLRTALHILARHYETPPRKSR